MLMCVLSAAMTACNCHPLLAEMMNYNTNTTNTMYKFSMFFSQNFIENWPTCISFYIPKIGDFQRHNVLKSSQLYDGLHSGSVRSVREEIR